MKPESSGRVRRHPIITNVEPPYWWTGMADPALQVMLTGEGVGAASVSVDYPGVTLRASVALDSPDYKLLYLDIAPDAHPGRVPLCIELEGSRTILEYELKARDMAPEDYTGFSAADVLYLLMPDRFARGRVLSGRAAYKGLEHKVRPNRKDTSGRHGGNLRGIREHLDYIRSLGVTAIWLCPVFENDMPGGSYHGYATTDYYRIDPRLGSNEEWCALVEEAHRHGLKVVMDMIFNHTGSNHPWMKNKPSADWYNHPDGGTITNYRLATLHDPYASAYDLDHTVNGWFVDSMPDLNQRNPHLMKYLTQNSIWWVESSKIDGMRMDTYPYADMEAMACWAGNVMREYPNFNIVGECWYGNPAGSAFWQRGSRLNPKETNLPTVMDFSLAFNARRMFSGQTDMWGGFNLLYDHLAMDFLYADPQHVLTFFDNHDTDRFLPELPETLDAWKQAWAFLLTSRGIPQIYYGSEILMHGTRAVTDGHIRLDMPGGFPGDKTDAFSPGGRNAMQNEAWNYLSSLLHWRRSEPVNAVVAEGTLKHFIPQNGLYVYERRLGHKRIVVLLNGSAEQKDMRLDFAREVLPCGSQWHDFISGDDVTVTPAMNLRPYAVMILQNF